MSDTKKGLQYEMSSVEEDLKELGADDQPQGEGQGLPAKVTVALLEEKVARLLKPSAKRRFYEVDTEGEEDPVKVRVLTDEEIALIRPRQPAFTDLDLAVWKYLLVHGRPGQLVTDKEVEKTLRNMDEERQDFLGTFGDGSPDYIYYSALVKFGEPVEPWGTVRLSGIAWEVDTAIVARSFQAEQEAAVSASRAYVGDTFLERLPLR